MATRPAQARVSGAWTGLGGAKPPESSRTHLSSNFTAGQATPQGPKNGDMWLNDKVTPPQKFWFWGEVRNTAGAITTAGAWHSDSGIRSFIQPDDPNTVAGGNATPSEGDLWVIPATPGGAAQTHVWVIPLATATVPIPPAAHWEVSNGGVSAPPPALAPKFLTAGGMQKPFPVGVYFKYIGRVDTEYTDASFLGFTPVDLLGNHLHGKPYDGIMSCTYGESGGKPAGAASFELTGDANGIVWFRPAGWPAIVKQTMPIELEIRTDDLENWTFMKFTQSGVWVDGRPFFSTTEFIVRNYKFAYLEFEDSANAGKRHYYYLKCVATA